MKQKFNLTVFQNLSQSHTRVRDFSLDVGVEDTMDTLIRHVRGYIKLRNEFHSFGKDVDCLNFVVHQLPCDEQEGDINDQLNTENPLPPGVDLKTLGVSPKLTFIFESSLFHFALVETIGGVPRLPCIKTDNGTPNANVGVIIKEAARFFEESQNGYDSSAGMHLYELQDPISLVGRLSLDRRKQLNPLIGSYARAPYELQPHTVLKDIEQPNSLIVAFRRTKSSFRYALVEDLGSSHKCFTVGEVSDALLGDKVDVIVQDAKKLLKSHCPSNLEVNVCVLDPKEPFDPDESLYLSKELGGYIKNSSKSNPQDFLECITQRNCLIITFKMQVGHTLFGSDSSPYRCIPSRK